MKLIYVYKSKVEEFKLELRCYLDFQASGMPKDENLVAVFYMDPYQFNSSNHGLSANRYSHVLKSFVNTYIRFLTPKNS